MPKIDAVSPAAGFLEINTASTSGIRRSARVPKKREFQDYVYEVCNARAVVRPDETRGKRSKRTDISDFVTRAPALVQIERLSTRSEDEKNEIDLDGEPPSCCSEFSEKTVTVLDDSVNEFLKTMPSWNTILLDMLREDTSFDKCRPTCTVY